MLFISPPFGNYLYLPCTNQILGSFTLDNREGLYQQIINTLSYSYKYNGWINKIGLRNKGIEHAINIYNKSNNDNKIYSIAILDEKEISILIQKIPNKMNIELNVSCPNLDKKMINKGLSSFLNDNRKWCIIKLSPKTDHNLIDSYYKQGFRQFHCSNTLPVKEGGLSGKTLIPYTEKLITYIKKKYPDTELIAGGGVQEWDDVINYYKIGANHISVSTICFNPFKLGLLYLNFIQPKNPPDLEYMDMFVL